MQDTLDIIINDDAEFFEDFSINYDLRSLMIPMWFRDFSEFRMAISNLKGIKFRLWIHLGGIDRPGKGKYKGEQIGSNITNNFPSLEYQYITRASNISNIGIKTVYYTETITSDEKKINSIPVNFPPNSGEITSVTISENTTINSNYPKVKYGIITALYNDEFEKIKDAFEYEEEIPTEKKNYQLWHLKNNPAEKLVAVFQSRTGIVDAAIIATDMVNRFSPDFLFMTGVCGGDPEEEELSFGDIIIASNVFIFQKGKISGLEDEQGKEVTVFESEINDIDIKDMLGNTSDRIEEVKDKICRKIESEYRKETKKLGVETIITNLKAIYQPMACSMMVINKEGYFEEKIKIHDRNTIAVEMESYGVARACQIANNGKTKAIIIKSVMDKTKEKDDRNKAFAAYTSARFVRYLITDGIFE